MTERLAEACSCASTWMCQPAHTIKQSYQSLTSIQQWGSLCYHRNRIKLPCLPPRRSLICQAPLYPGNTMTSLRLCCLTGILTMQRQGWGTGAHSPDMLLQQLFSFLCSGFILCNPFVPLLSLRLPLSPALSLSHIFSYLFILSSPNPWFFYLPSSAPSSYKVISSGLPNN